MCRLYWRRRKEGERQEIMKEKSGEVGEVKQTPKVAFLLLSSCAC